MYGSIFYTKYGHGVVYANDQAVVKVEIPDMSLLEPDYFTAPLGCSTSCLTEYAAGLLEKYYNGYRVDFLDISISLAGITPFRQAALTWLRYLDYGTVSTYGYMAKACGFPGAARAVGAALAANPVPVIIPCHRVVASDGSLTGFSAAGGIETKMKLLKLEGIEFRQLQVIKKQLVINSNSPK